MRELSEGEVTKWPFPRDPRAATSSQCGKFRGLVSSPLRLPRHSSNIQRQLDVMSNRWPFEPFLEDDTVRACCVNRRRINPGTEV